MCTIWSLVWIYAESYSVHFEMKTNKPNLHLVSFFTNNKFYDLGLISADTHAHTVLTDSFSLYENARKAPSSRAHFLARPLIQLQCVYGHTTGAKNIHVYTRRNLFLKCWGVDTAAKVCKHRPNGTKWKREKESEKMWSRWNEWMGKKTKKKSQGGEITDFLQCKRLCNMSCRGNTFHVIDPHATAFN